MVGSANKNVSVLSLCICYCIRKHRNKTEQIKLFDRVHPRVTSFILSVNVWKKTWMGMNNFKIFGNYNECTYNLKNTYNLKIQLLQLFHNDSHGNCPWSNIWTPQKHLTCWLDQFGQPTFHLSCPQIRKPPQTKPNCVCAPQLNI